MSREPAFFAINALRFAAASWVLLFHASLHFGPIGWMSPLQPVIDQGVLAMTLFFTLSGFILAHRYRVFQDGDKVRFYAARIARLYPVYLVMGLATFWLVPDAFDAFVLPAQFGLMGQILFTLVLLSLYLLALQAWFPGLFGVWNFNGSWSLSVEAFFYALFPSLRGSLARQGDSTLLLILLALPLVMLLVVVGMIVSKKPGADLLTFYVLPFFRLPEFLFGIVGFILFMERRRHLRLLRYLALACAGLLILGIMAGDLPGFLDYSGLALFPFMALFVVSTALSAPNWVKKSANYLGKVSYCLYLAQFFTIPLLEGIHRERSIEEAWVMLMASTFLVAVVAYHLVEVRFYEGARRMAEGGLVRLSARLRQVFNG